MKKLTILLSMILLCTCVWANRYKNDVEFDKFKSENMLNEHYGENVEKASDYWNDVKVSLVTISKANPVYAWFGHAGFLIEKPNKAPFIVDYGRFSFDEKFYVNFTMGRLLYCCSLSNADAEMHYYDLVNRSVRKIELNLTAQQKKNLTEFLELNTSDGYNTYLYDYFEDNCSTRLRDAINKVSDGRFEKWAKLKEGYTYRQQISMILCNNIPVQWGLDFLLSGKVDRPATLWDEMFLPKNLAEAVVSFENLSLSDRFEIDKRAEDSRPVDSNSPRSYSLISLCAGLFASLFILLTYNRARFLSVSINFAINLVLGLTGTLLLFFMIFTNHSFTFWNENILFINPLLFVTAFMTFKQGKHKKILRIIYTVLSAMIVLLIILKVGIHYIFIQNNYAQMLTVLPFYITNAILVTRVVKEES